MKKKITLRDVLPSRPVDESKRRAKLAKDLAAVKKRFNSAEEKARLADLVLAMGDPSRWSVVVCQECGNRILQPTATCGICGTIALIAPDLLPKPEGAPDAPELNYCKVCSAPLTSKRFCYTCGSRVESPKGEI